MADEPAARSKVRTALAGAGALLAAAGIVVAAYRLGHPPEPDPSQDPTSETFGEPLVEDDANPLDPDADPLAPGVGPSDPESTTPADETEPAGGASPTPENEKDPLAGEGDAETATLPFENEKDPGTGNG